MHRFGLDFRCYLVIIYVCTNDNINCFCRNNDEFKLLRDPVTEKQPLFNTIIIRATAHMQFCNVRYPNY